MMSERSGTPEGRSRPRPTLSIRARSVGDAVQRFFSPCPRGLEAVLAEELTALDAAHVAEAPGGVGFEGPFTLGQQVCLHSRVASRVLWRLAEAEYRTEADLYRLARSIDWPHLFTTRETIRVQVDAVRAPLRSLDFVALRVKDAVVDAFRAAMNARPSVDTARPDMRIHVFLTAWRATIYLDLAGEALFKRGYRRDTVAAPLRENLAAGILLLKKWRGERVLLDPMMGSGTFLAEAAMIATGRAPGRDRHFAFERLRAHDPDAWRALRMAADRGVRALPDGLLHGNDTDPQAIRATRANLTALGGPAWVEAIRIAEGPVEQMTPPEAGPSGGLLVCNPPYGERLETLAALHAWYPDLGRWMKHSLTGWTACFLTADREFPSGIGFKPAYRTPLYNGPLECRLYEFEMYAGSRRAGPARRPRPAERR